GSNVDTGTAASALSNLLGSGSSINLGDVVGQLQNQGGSLATMAKSWLGDGENMPMSPSQVSEVLGSEQVQDFAQKLGVDQNEAAAGLSDMLPKLIDKTSSGGNLLESLGGLGGLAGMASKFMK
ncbi:MAG: DUF937 domain-containing protein, partial [Gammaproteobacteria bacterium]|nr:DUF937 domain-containing protein [Gammaproteobacteria bacterium]